MHDPAKHPYPPAGSGGPAYGGRPGYSAPGMGPGGGAPPPAAPRRPERRRRRIFPILFAVVFIIGFLMVGLFFIVTMALGGLGSALGNVNLGGRPIALLRIEGPIMPGVLNDFWMSSLDAIAEDASIKGVVLRIDSPGGAVGTSQELYDQVLRLREGGKRVFVSMGNVAASGGYYIAAAADRIFANGGTTTGSIGVIMEIVHIEGLAEKAGIGAEAITSGRYKGAGSMFREMTEDERMIFGLTIDDTYRQFLEAILDERTAQIETALTSFDEEGRWEEFLFERPAEISAREFLLRIADGRVYTGAQAADLGLVDELGGLHHTIARMAEELGVPGDTEIYEPTRELTFFELLSARVGDALPLVGRTRAPLQFRMIP